MESGEVEAASVLDENENKAEKPMLFKSWCHLTMVPETRKETVLLEGCLNFDKWAPKSARICDADEGKLLKGKQCDRSHGNPVSSGWMKIDQTARQSHEKCCALA